MMETIFEVKIDNDKMMLGFREGLKSAQYREKILFSLEDLVREVIPFRESTDLNAFMDVCNFFFGGLDFLPIKDIPAFQTYYEKQLMDEAKSGQSLLRQYGHFNLQEMHPPKIKEGKFICFVQSTAFGIPYKLTCDYPYNNSSCSFSYTLLPLVA